MRALVALLSGLLLVTGCGGSSSAGPGVATKPAPTRGSMNVIDAQEIAEAKADFMTAWDLVLNLRPAMLRARGSGSSYYGGETSVVAYLGDMRLGGVNNLQSVPRAQVREIRYWTPTEATQKWGTNHAGGAIQVFVKR